MTIARPTFVSFFCGDPYYRRAAGELEAQCARLGVPLLMTPLPDSGSYWRNTLRKPGFIRDQLAELRSDLFWVDADTRLHTDHADFHRLTTDVTAASHTGDLVGVKASPLGFAFNERTFAFLDAWAAVCDARLALGDADLDHDILKYEILPAFAGRVTLRLLGDPARPREMADGGVLTNGLSRKAFAEIAPTLRRNRVRAAAFAHLRLEDFAQLRT